MKYSLKVTSLPIGIIEKRLHLSSAQRLTELVYFYCVPHLNQILKNSVRICNILLLVF